jgi:hypothetical protein
LEVSLAGIVAALRRGGLGIVGFVMRVQKVRKVGGFGGGFRV